MLLEYSVSFRNNRKMAYICQKKIIKQLQQNKRLLINLTAIRKSSNFLKSTESFLGFLKKRFIAI